MKLFIFLIVFGTIISSSAQNPTYQEWLEIAEEDISLQPEYGNAQKRPEEKDYDAAFIAKIMEEMKDTIQASKKLADLGFQYLYARGDVVTAMRRFNQAYLLNPQNPDAYLGYGTIYTFLGAPLEARMLYDKGLVMDPQNPMLITAYGTTYLGEYYRDFDTNREAAEASLEKALEYFLQSEKLDDTIADTMYKLSIVYLYRDNCRLSTKYFKQAKKLNHPDIPPRYEQQLKASC